MDDQELQESFDEMMSLYEDIKSEVKRRNKHAYESWKAGGFLIDDDIISMYPYLGKVVESLTEEVEEEEEEEEEVQ